MKIVSGAPGAPSSQSSAGPASRPQPGGTAAASSFEAPRRPAPVALVPPSMEIRTGPLALDSARAQGAIQQVQSALAPQTCAESGAGGDGFVPLQVNQDAVGGLHVRMQRTFEGTKVFGEQRIGHLDRSGALTDVTGEVEAIRPGLADGVKLSAEQAESAARQAFGKAPDEKPSVEKVIFRDDQGNYRAGYHVELADFSGPGLARRMNYMVDGATGEVVKSWNALGGFEMPHGDHGEQRPEAAAGRQFPFPMPPRPMPFPMPPRPS